MTTIDDHRAETLLTRVKKLLRWSYYRLFRVRYYALASRWFFNVAELLGSPAHRAKRLIIFLVPGEEVISGGILSIFNLYRFSRAMEAIHGAHVVMCYYPCDARTASRYAMFDNDITIYPFEM